MRVSWEPTAAPDAELRDSFQPYLEALECRPELAEHVRDCEHKCRAADYHFRAIQAEIEQQVKRYSNEHRPQGVGLIRRNEILLYETEAFLFQARSGVDMLIRALSPVVPSLANFTGFQGKKETAGGAVLEALVASEPQLHSLFEAARQEWIQELKESRDTVTHDSQLPGFNYFVENGYYGGPDATIEYPTMPSGRRLDEYCGDITEKLADLTHAALDELVRRAAGGQ